MITVTPSCYFTHFDGSLALATSFAHSTHIVSTSLYSLPNLRMTVSTRANWKVLIQATSKSFQGNISSTDVPDSPLSNVLDEEDSTLNTSSSSTTTPSEDQTNPSPSNADLQSIQGSTENHSADITSPALTNNTSNNSVDSPAFSLPVSSYTDFLGEFSLLPASSWSPSTASKKDDQIFIAASLLMPIGSCLTYYSNPHNWSLFCPDSGKPSQISTEIDIIQSLYLNTSYANKCSILLLEDPKYISAQVKKMFMIKPDPKLANYAHILFQVAVLDCFAWSILPLQTTDIHRLASVSKPTDLPEHALSLISSCQNWQKTLVTAAQHFLVHETAETESANLQSSNSQQPDGAVESLGFRLMVSKNNTVVNHIEQNFISAAIALRGLAEVKYSVLILARSF